MPYMNGPLMFNRTHGMLISVASNEWMIQWMSTATFSILIRGHAAHLEDDDDEVEDDGDDHDDELQQ